ncbi:hypothetical protein [Nocardia sp. NPDC058666]|uniref:hypothetical protein n=1 Tax=unclassified Nocardia TaxID=2637762 RepID=UPI003645FBD2
MSFNIDPSEWQRLNTRAAAGELSIHPDVGQNLAKVCDDHIDVLENVLKKSRQVENITGFGTFSSSQVLEKKFSLTAVGGDRSLDDAIRQHIEAVTAAKEAVLKAVANYKAQDDYNAGQFDGLGGNG